MLTAGLICSIGTAALSDSSGNIVYPLKASAAEVKTAEDFKYIEII